MERRRRADELCRALSTVRDQPSDGIPLASALPRFGSPRRGARRTFEEAQVEPSGGLRRGRGVDCCRSEASSEVGAGAPAPMVGQPMSGARIPEHELFLIDPTPARPRETSTEPTREERDRGYSCVSRLHRRKRSLVYGFQGFVPNGNAREMLSVHAPRRPQSLPASVRGVSGPQPPSRFHRTLKLHVPAKRHLGAQQRAFDCFRAEYNYERPHTALQLAVPGDWSGVGSRESRRNADHLSGSGGSWKKQASHGLVATRFQLQVDAALDSIQLFRFASFVWKRRCWTSSRATLTRSASRPTRSPSIHRAKTFSDQDPG